MSASALELQAVQGSSMAGRLLRGVVRRNRWAVLGWVWMVPMMMRIVSDTGVNVAWFMAASMGLAFMLGGQSGDGIGCREHRVLPVTDRDLWVTRWLNTALVGPTFLFLAKSVGIALAAATSEKNLLTPEMLLLSTLFDFVYAGALMPAPLLLESAAVPLARRLGKPALLVSLTLMPLLFLVAIGGPLLVARALPTRLTELSVASALILLFGLAMSVAGLLWTPPRGGVTNIFWTPRHDRTPAGQKAMPRATLGQPIAHRRLSDRLTGVYSIGWAHIRLTVILTAVGIAVATAAAPLSPFENAENPRFLTGMFLIFTFMGISMSSVWAPWARRLKVLPLSVNQVNALFVLTPVVTWLVVWLMVLLVHAVVGLPINEELGPLAVLMYAGLSAVSHSLGLWLMGNVAGQTAASMVGLISAVGTAMALFEKPDGSTRLLLLAICLLSLVVAALINHYTLTRSTSSARAYRTLGIPMKP